MAESLEDDMQYCIVLANKLIEVCGLRLPKISSLHEVNCTFFVALIERVTGHAVPDLFLKDDISTDARLMQKIIHRLSDDIIGISLSHISGENIIAGDLMSIINLLEVLAALFMQLPQLQNEKSRFGKNKESTSSSLSLTESEEIMKVKTSRSTCSNLSTDNEQDAFLQRGLKPKICSKTLPKSTENEKMPEAMKKPPQHKSVDQSRKMCPSNDVTSPIKTNFKTTSRIVKERVNPEDIFFSVPDKSNQIFQSRKTNPLMKNMTSQMKKNVKTTSRIVKERVNPKDHLLQLYDSNFEKKVRLTLQSDMAPFARAQQLKNNYLKNLNKPPKRIPIAPCRKSYLLPHYLRPKSKPPVKQSQSNKEISRKHVVKNTENRKKDKEVPAPIQSILEKFPGFKLSDNSNDYLMKHYYQHISAMHKNCNDILLKKPLTLTQTGEVVKYEERISKILEKDLQSSNRMRKLQEYKARNNRVQSSLKDAVLQAVRIRQYLDEFHKCQNIQKRNFSEEVKSEKILIEILDLQKKKLLLICIEIQEADEDDANLFKVFLSTLQDFFLQQLSSLTEPKKSSLRSKEQRLVPEKSNQELYKKLKGELRCLQKDVLDMLD